MNKMEYQKPWAEFVEFSNEDVITASGYEGCKYLDVGHYHDGCVWIVFGDWYWCGHPTGCNGNANPNPGGGKGPKGYSEFSIDESFNNLEDGYGIDVDSDQWDE